jgi:DNA polymerase-3 subunit epsilon
MPAILARFNEMKSKCTDRVAYNATYDKRMLLREAQLYDIPHNSDGLITHDVMKMATPVCKMPPTEKMRARGRYGNKSPKLEEAYRIMFGERLDGAHDAMNDVKATARLFFHLLNGGVALDAVA